MSSSSETNLAPKASHDEGDDLYLGGMSLYQQDFQSLRGSSSGGGSASPTSAIVNGGGGSGSISPMTTPHPPSSATMMTMPSRSRTSSRGDALLLADSAGPSVVLVGNRGVNELGGVRRSRN